MIKTNEGEKERIRNPKADELITEMNNLNVRLKMLGG